MKQQQSDASFFDDLADALDYFEDKAEAKAKTERRPLKTTAESIPLSVNETPSPSPPVANFQPHASPESKVKQTPPLNSAEFANLGLAWKSIRRAPLSAAEFDLLPPAPGWTSSEPEPVDADDLFADKVERLIHQFKPSDKKNKDYLRDLLSKNRSHKVRAQILALLDKNRTPLEVKMIEKIRLRCQALFLNLSRITLWGKRYAAGANTTVSWSLATQLWDSGIYQRGELFRFFRRLCDEFETDPSLERTYRGVLTFAPFRLTGGEVQAQRDTDRVIKRRLLHLQLERPWWGEDLRRTGLPSVVSSIGLVSSSAARKKLNWDTGFHPYKTIRGHRLTDLMEYPELLKYCVSIESPVTKDYLRSTVTTLTKNSSHKKTVLQKLIDEDRFVLLGRDVWLNSDLEYLVRGGARSPRLPSQEGPTLKQATLFDIGLGLTTLQAHYSGQELRTLQKLFLTRWNRERVEDPDAFIDIILKSYNRLYGRLVHKR